MAWRWTSDRTPSTSRTVSASRPAATSAQTSGRVKAGGGGSSQIGQLGRRPAAPDGVDRPVVDDRQQPRLHAAAPFDVAGGIPPRAQERVLDDVLGQGRVIRDAVGDRVGHRLVAVIQVLESIELSVGQTARARPGPPRPSRMKRGAGAARSACVIPLCASRRVSVHRATASRSAARGHGDAATSSAGLAPRRRPRIAPARPPRGPGTRRGRGGGRRGRTRPRSG